MEIQDYTDNEFKHALARNLRSLTRGKKSSKQPIAILLGGQRLCRIHQRFCRENGRVFSNRIESFGIQSFDRGNFTND